MATTLSNTPPHRASRSCRVSSPIRLQAKNKIYIIFSKTKFKCLVHDFVITYSLQQNILRLCGHSIISALFLLSIFSIGLPTSLGFKKITIQNWHYLIQLTTELLLLCACTCLEKSPRKKLFRG